MKNIESQYTVIKTATMFGTPCFKVTFSKGKYEADWKNAIMEEVIQSGMKTVLFDFNISENSEVLDVVRNLAETARFTIVVATGADDDIEVLRNIRGVQFILSVNDLNTLNGKNFPLLKEQDEVIFGAEDIKALQANIEAVKNRLISRPVITFVLVGNDEFKTEATTLIMNTKFTSRIRIIN